MLDPVDLHQWQVLCEIPIKINVKTCIFKLTGCTH
jgi:hypothetical protein